MSRRVSIKLIKMSKDWKDKLAGWHHYRVFWICPGCGKRVSEDITGVFEDIKGAYKKRPLCEDCGGEL